MLFKFFWGTLSYIFRYHNSWFNLKLPLEISLLVFKQTEIKLVAQKVITVLPLKLYLLRKYFRVKFVSVFTCLVFLGIWYILLYQSITKFYLSCIDLVPQKIFESILKHWNLNDKEWQNVTKKNLVEILALDESKIKYKSEILKKYAKVL